MDPFIGEIRMFAGNFAPDGWAMCDGSLQSIAANDALFSLLGTSYGGDGVNTFGLPDLRGRVPVNQGTNQRDGVPYAVGQTGGAETVALGTADILAHSHLLLASQLVGTSADPTNAIPAVAPADTQFYRETPATNPLAAGHVTGGVGTSQPHANIQPYQTVNYIIATAGIWPSQN